MRGLPRQTRAASAAATRQLEDTFPKVERLLNQRVDKLMWQFRASDANFYQLYQVARVVVSGGTATNSTVAPVVAVPKAA